MFLYEATYFLLRHDVRTVCDARPAFPPVATGGKADQSLPSSVKAKHAWISTSSPAYAFVAWC
jgi:hypothetical protein